MIGLNPLSHPGYDFWSGIGNDLPIYVLGFLPLWWNHHRCHTRGCHRIGRYKVSGTPYVVCHKHHPEIDSRRTPARAIKLAHNKARARAALGHKITSTIK